MSAIDLNDGRRGSPIVVMSQDWDVELKRTYECDILICAENEGVFSAHAVQLPGVVSQGETIAEAVANVTEAFEGALSEYLDSGGDIPWANEEEEAWEFFNNMKVAAKRRIAVDV